MRKSKFSKIGLAASQRSKRKNFPEFGASRTEIWKEHELVQQRTLEIRQRWGFSQRKRPLTCRTRISDNSRIYPHPHAFHLLINQLALRSGYNAASIKERLLSVVVEMNGFGFHWHKWLRWHIGGLARLAEANLFENLVLGAVSDSMWCSSGQSAQTE